jgi:uncharacterized protein Yka (UPF0111/DUF47 family)
MTSTELISTHDRFYDLLEQEAACVEGAAELLASIPPPPSRDEDLGEMGARARDLVRQIEVGLAGTHVSVMDRSDLRLLATELDEILEAARAAARAVTRAGFDSLGGDMGRLAAILVDTTRALREAVSLLRGHERELLVAQAARVREMELAAEGVYRSAVTRLFSDASIDASDLAREKTVLEEMSSAIYLSDQCGRLLTRMGIHHA